MRLVPTVIRGGLGAATVTAGAFLAFALVPSAWPWFLQTFLAPSIGGRKLLPWSVPKFPFGNLYPDVEWARRQHLRVRQAARFVVHWVLWQPLVIVTTTQDAKQLLAPRITLQCSDRDLGKFMPLWDLAFGKALFMVGSTLWKRQHRIALRVIGSRHTDSFFGVMEATAREVVQGLVADHRANGRAQYDTPLQAYFGQFTLRVIVRTAIGDHVPDMPQFIRDLEFLIQCTGDPRFLIPGFLWLPFGRPAQLRRVVASLHALAAGLVAAKRRELEQDPTKREHCRTLLERLCAAVDSEEGALTEQEVVHNTFGFMAAGYETTKSSLTHAAFLLAKHPVWQDRIIEELDRLHHGPDMGPDARWEELDHLPHLSAFLLENLRLHPPVVGLVSRNLVEDAVLGDVVCPKGTALIVNSLGQNSAPESWGPDSLEFRPERFLPALREHNGDAMQALESFGVACVTFGGGIRPCIGRHMALMEMKVLLVELLRSFQLVEVDPHRTEFMRPLLRVFPGSRVGLILRP